MEKYTEENRNEMESIDRILECLITIVDTLCQYFEDKDDYPYKAHSVCIDTLDELIDIKESRGKSDED